MAVAFNTRKGNGVTAEDGFTVELPNSVCAPFLFGVQNEKATMQLNTLYYGDNLEVLRKHITDNSIDLIYLDPPFQSGKNYNLIFEEKNGSKSSSQIRAFEDTWYWDKVAEETYREIIEKVPIPKLKELIQGLRNTLGNNDMMAYLVMMAIRLVELHRVLKDTGSIYLHCDPTASHYIKLVMDVIFDVRNFQNEIVWHYRRWSAAANSFQKMHDIIFWYSKSYKYIFTKPLQPYSNEKWIEDTVRGVVNGKLVRLKDKHGNYIKRQKENLGVLMHDVWEDINFIPPTGKERLGYPTQKPEALLERIIKASSNEGDIVLDPFCGCGTATVVAEKLQRKWIGIDITHLAINVIKWRLNDSFRDKVKYKVIGEPMDAKGAEELAEQDRFQFQYWALGLIGGIPADTKVSDRGIDGYIYFLDEEDKTKFKKIIIQVKSGHIAPSQIRDLKGVVEREKAQIGVFITLTPPTKEMRKEAVSSGYYESLWGKFPKIQIITVEELLEGKKIDYPSQYQSQNITYKKAEAKSKNGEQISLY